MPGRNNRLKKRRLCPLKRPHIRRWWVVCCTLCNGSRAIWYSLQGKGLKLKLKSNALLMKCCVPVIAQDGSSVEARVLLGNALPAPFLFEWLLRSLSLPYFNQHVWVSGIGSVSQKVPQCPPLPSRLTLVGCYVADACLCYHLPLCSPQGTQFWEIEEAPVNHSALSAKKQMVVQHFKSTNPPAEEGWFLIPLPRNPLQNTLVK